MSSVGKERYGSDDRETVGNSMGRVPLGRSAMEATTRRTDGKRVLGCAPTLIATLDSLTLV